MVGDAVRKGYNFVELLTALDGVHPLKNIIRKEWCHHFIQLQWGCLGQGIRKNVQDCVADTFRFKFSAPGGVFMDHRDSYSASALCQHCSRCWMSQGVILISRYPNAIGIPTKSGRRTAAKAQTWRTYVCDVRLSVTPIWSYRGSEQFRSFPPFSLYVA
jgi:hypothetical protein